MSKLVTEKLVIEKMEKDHMEKLYNSRNPLVRFVCNQRLKKIIKIIPKKEGLKILDAGCGEGQLLLKLSKVRERKRELYGADITPVAVESAKEKVGGVNFSLQNLKNLNYEDGFFNVVICTEVIEHITDYHEAIKELKRVLKRGGLLIITFPNEPLAIFFRAIFFRKSMIEDHINWFSPNKMMRIVGLKLKDKINIPFPIFDFISLIHIMVFVK